MTASLENPFAGQGSVLLDIGGDVGAVVVTLPVAMLGAEVEIRPVDEDRRGHSHHPHVAVVNRPARGTWVPSLVFPEVLEGRYLLQQRDTQVARMSVDVRGGEVTTVAWPA